jgi:hypothetical protein
MRHLHRSAMTALLALLWLPSSAGANVCGFTSLGTYHWTASGQLTRSNNCFGGSGFRCYPAQGTSWSLETTPGCDPTAGSCGVKIHAFATIPGLRDMVVEDGLGGSPTPRAFWYPCSGAGCTQDMICGLDGAGGRINFDNLDTWLERGLSCAQATTLNLSVRIEICPFACTSAVVIDIPAPDLAQALGCPVPPPPPCTEPGGGSSGASGGSCPLCQPVGGGGGSPPPCSVPVAGGGPQCDVPGGGPGAKLRYAAGGVGGDGLPGAGPGARCSDVSGRTTMPSGSWSIRTPVMSGS